MFSVSAISRASSRKCEFRAWLGKLLKNRLLGFQDHKLALNSHLSENGRFLSEMGVNSKISPKSLIIRTERSINDSQIFRFAPLQRPCNKPPKLVPIEPFPQNRRETRILPNQNCGSFIGYLKRYTPNDTPSLRLPKVLQERKEPSFG